MTKSDDMWAKASIGALHEAHPYFQNIAPRGLMVDGRPAMTGIDPEKVGDYILVLVRDPLCAYDDDPARIVAKRLEDVVVAGKSGMFLSLTGTYKGAKITVASGGSGSPEAELLLYDFLEFTDASTFLRAGGSGGLGDNVHPGDVVVSSGVMRDEGLTRAYIGAGYPAVCHYEVVSAMAEAAEALGQPYHIGVTVSTDSDFLGTGRPYAGGYLQPDSVEKPGVYNRAGILNNDRESAAIVTLAALFGRRGGSVCSVADNICTGEKFVAGAGHSSAIEIALEGCALLHRMDEWKKQASKQNWHPSLWRQEEGL